MKLKSDIDFTYMGYLHNVWYANDQTEEQEIYALLEKFKQFSLSGVAFLPTFFILDYTKSNYLIFTDSVKNIIDYDARDLLSGGVDFSIDKMQKNYFNVINKKMFPLTIRYLQDIPWQQQSDYVFSFNNQFINSKGKSVNILQKAIYITSKETNLPLYCVGFIIDISIYKRDRTVVHSVERINKVTNHLELVEVNYIYPYEEDTLLTKQEKNIVKWMADGLSTKMIADKLYLSENTINAHRKNMLRKTNTKNVAQLIAFVIRNNII